MSMHIKYSNVFSKHLETLNDFFGCCFVLLLCFYFLNIFLILFANYNVLFRINPKLLLLLFFFFTV